MRYRLRTLMIVLAIGPPMIWFGWSKYQAWVAGNSPKQEKARPDFPEFMDIGQRIMLNVY